MASQSRLTISAEEKISPAGRAAASLTALAAFFLLQRTGPPEPGPLLHRRQEVLVTEAIVKAPASPIAAEGVSAPTDAARLLALLVAASVAAAAGC